jgi:hypothetical protein
MRHGAKPEHGHADPEGLGPRDIRSAQQDERARADNREQAGRGLADVEQAAEEPAREHEDEEEQVRVVGGLGVRERGSDESRERHERREDGRLPAQEQGTGRQEREGRVPAAMIVELRPDLDLRPDEDGDHCGVEEEGAQPSE